MKLMITRVRCYILMLLLVSLMLGISSCWNPFKHEPPNPPPAPPKTLIAKWSGDGGVGNPGDTVFYYMEDGLSYYEMTVKVERSGSGVDGMPVTFTAKNNSSDGDLVWDKYNSQTGSSVTLNTHNGGRASVWLILGNYGTTPDRFVDATASVDAPNTVTFHAKAISDLEACTPYNTHIRRYPDGYPPGWPISGYVFEIKGDGIAPTTLKKKLHVEVYMDNTYNKYTRDTVLAAMNFVKDIFRTADIEVEYSGPSPNIVNVPFPMSLQDAKELLARRVNKAWPDKYLVVGLGSEPTSPWGNVVMTDVVGINVEMASLWNISDQDSMAHYATMSTSSYVLDSLGCVVFLGRLFNYTCTPNFTQPQLLAVAMAHEMGHALGFSYHIDAALANKFIPPPDPLDQSAMFAPLPRPSDGKLYTWFNYFFANTMDGKKISDALNNNPKDLYRVCGISTKTVLGRETATPRN